MMYTQEFCDLASMVASTKWQLGCMVSQWRNEFSIDVFYGSFSV